MKPSRPWPRSSSGRLIHGHSSPTFIPLFFLSLFDLAVHGRRDLKIAVKAHGHGQAGVARSVEEPPREPWMS
ncbi:hypothetical protein EUGRSUZ_G00689 [Eucalyptus grandis]|uniref:Uncharacterized protein n=2 Tax=Eucalyptus grandis TaxID=71139 RepID=A0A059BB22_EUCGR|nr:hypothetical protein EUGRSUZ_G00689 [Eucalyptus grandis]